MCSIMLISRKEGKIRGEEEDFVCSCLESSFFVLENQKPFYFKMIIIFNDTELLSINQESFINIMVKV